MELFVDITVTLCLSIPLESTSESFSVKMRPVKSLHLEIGFDFPPPRRVLYNLDQPEGNAKSMIFPSKSLNLTRVSFDITLLILLRLSLFSQYDLVGTMVICGDYFTVKFFGYHGVDFLFQVCISFAYFRFYFMFCMLDMFLISFVNFYQCILFVVISLLH